MPSNYQTLSWKGDATGSLWMIDQTLLPVEFREIECATVEVVWEAIKVLRVRGAPAIGVAAAYGVILGTQQARESSLETCRERLAEVTKYLAGSRPTAVNLFWALERMQRKAAATAVSRALIEPWAAASSIARRLARVASSWR